MPSSVPSMPDDVVGVLLKQESHHSLINGLLAELAENNVLQGESARGITQRSAPSDVSFGSFSTSAYYSVACWLRHSDNEVLR